MRTLGKSIRMRVNDLTVSYNDEGPDQKPVVIFIHGFPFSKSMWERQVEVLKDTCRVISYDVRGHGNTDTGIEDFSMDLFVNDLVCLMDALKLDKVFLCVLSMGGYIALNAMEKYPARFDGLVLSDTQCIADTPEAKEKRMKAIDSIKQHGVEKYADESLKNLFTPGAFTSRKEGIASIREMIVKTSETTLCNTLLAISARKETCSKLHEIKVPVLILVGKEDKITPPAAALLMHERIKDSSMNILAHAGHLSNIENPDDFNYQLKKFVERVTKKPFPGSSSRFSPAIQS